MISYLLSAGLYTLLLFAGMLLCGEAGRRLARYRRRTDPSANTAGFGTIDGAVFGLLGLIIAFSFSGAVSRFDERRNMVVEEANAIGTAYLRLDLLPTEAQPTLREILRQYLDSRLSFYRELPDRTAAAAEMAKTAQLQAKLWSVALTAGRDAPPPAQMLLIPALNDMFDIAAARNMMLLLHPPQVIFVMLVGLAFISSAFAGHGMSGSASRDWLRVISFAAVTSLAFYVILDIEFPRQGLIRITEFDRALSDLRASM